MRLIDNIKKLLGIENYRGETRTLTKRIYYFGSKKEGEERVYYFSIQDGELTVHAQESTENPRDFYTVQGKIEGGNLIRGGTKKEPRDITSVIGKRLNKDTGVTVEVLDCDPIGEDIEDLFFEALKEELVKPREGPGSFEDKSKE